MHSTYDPAPQPPHIATGASDPTFVVGPLTPRSCAGLLAEVIRSAPSPRCRPLVFGHIDQAADRATVYIIDRFAQAWLALLLAPYQPELLPERPDFLRGDVPGVLPTTTMVQWWAEKPRRAA